MATEEKIKKANPTDQDPEELPPDPERLEEWRQNRRQRKADTERAEQLKKEIKQEVEKETGKQLDRFQVGPSQLFPTDAELGGIAELAQKKADEARERLLHPGKK